MRGRRKCEQLLDDLKETEKGSTRSHSMENSFWKKLRTCHKMDNRINKFTQGEKVVQDDLHEADENKRMQ
jgi:predicted DNA-binding ribbon-helix-helix protein